MYVILADGEPLYAPNLVNEGYVVTSAKLTKEINKAGSLEFTIPSVNPMYSELQKLKTIITVEQDGTEIFRGRILNDTKDFYKNKEVFCEGRLAFLNDVVVEPYDYSSEGITVDDYLDFLIGIYAEQCSDYRKISPGLTFGYTDLLIYPKLEDYSDVLTELNNVVIDPLGAYIDIEKPPASVRLDCYETIDTYSDQVIRFGTNLIDLEEYIDATDVYTVIYPLGKEDDNGNRVDVSSVHSGSKTINNWTGISLFGRITKVVYFDDIDDPQELEDAAYDTLNQAIKMAVSINIKAVDLHLLDVDTDRIDVASYVRVVSVPHGIDDYYLCSKVEIDLLHPENSDYTLGVNYSALTDRQVATMKESNSAYTISSKSTSSATFNSYRTSTDQQISALNARVTALENK